MVLSIVDLEIPIFLLSKTAEISGVVSTISSNSISRPVSSSFLASFLASFDTDATSNVSTTRANTIHRKWRLSYKCCYSAMIRRDTRQAHISKSECFLSSICRQPKIEPLKFQRFFVLVHYSSSIVPGGFPVQSYTTRFTWSTSFTMRVVTRSRSSHGRCAASAVMKSLVFTARRAIA